MSERLMKNFPIEYEGNTYWRSRSVAVAGFIFCKDHNRNWCVLLEKRGPGAPNENGKWCCPCGYLDFNEDGQQAISRECFEETGVKLKPQEFKFNSINFDREGEQNVTVRYTCLLQGYIEDYSLSNEFNEEGETSDIKWIPINEVDNMLPSMFAFGHYNLIFEMFAKA